VSLGLTVGGLISSAILTGGQTFVSPFSPAEQVAALLWLIAVGFLLPQNRAAANRQER
jgi:hypothetical protein